MRAWGGGGGRGGGGREEQKKLTFKVHRVSAAEPRRS